MVIAKGVVAKARAVAKASVPSTGSAASSPQPKISRKKSGNFVADNQVEAEEDLMEQVLVDLFADSSHLVPVFSLIQRRERSMSSRS